MEFDLAVIGSGPAGQKGAINAAKQGKKVAVIEKQVSPGGVCVNTGTIPSKALREAILHTIGYRARWAAGSRSLRRDAVTMRELHSRTHEVIRSEIEIIRDQMGRNGVRFISGTAQFVSPTRLLISRGDEQVTIDAAHTLIAVGSNPYRPPDVPFTPGRVIDSDEIMDLQELPRTLIVVGGGVIGAEYACMLAAVGVNVTLVDKRQTLLDFVDREIIEALQYHMREMNIRLRLCEEVASIQVLDDGIEATLASGKRLHADMVMYAAGREAATAALNLDAAGLTAEARGRLKVNEYFQTDVPNIYATGDVIGFPALAATSMEQGRLATTYMFGKIWENVLPLFPIGIYTIPEISMVGQTEAQLTEECIPFECGVARYREIARGKLIGDTIGMLKLVFHQESRRLLGVHVIGEGATELVHIGQCAMAAHMTIDYFVSSVFNYPTLAECYRVAGLDGINRARR